MSIGVTVALLIGALVLFSLDNVGSFQSNVVSDVLANNQSMFGGTLGEIIPLTVVLAIVFLFYMHRFSLWADDRIKPAGYPPRPARNFTTWLQFGFWSVVYGLFGCGIVLFIYAYPTLLMTLGDMPMLGKIIATLPVYDADRTSPLAYGVTVALGFLTIPHLEPRFRRGLQQAALIPSRATLVVDALTKDFNSFQPPKEDIKTFLQQFGADASKPKIFPGELELPHDQNFLEIYPRLEFLKWRLDQSRLSLSLERALMPFKDELREIDDGLREIRKKAVKTAKTVKLVANRSNVDLETVHSAAHVDREGSPLLAFTVLDNILHAIQGDDSVGDVELKLVECLFQELRDIRKQCNSLLNRLIKVSVLVTFSTKVKQPEILLRGIGLTYSGTVNNRPNSDTLIISMIVAIIAITAIVMVLTTVGFIKDFEVAIVTSVAMNASALIGGYFVGMLCMNEQRNIAFHDSDIRFKLLDWVKTFIGAWASVIFATYLCGLYFEYSGRSGIILFENSKLYAHVSALLGAAVGFACFRLVVGRRPFLLHHVVLLVAFSVAGCAVAAFVHFKGDIIGNPKALAFIASSAITPLVIGLVLYNPFQRTRPNEAPKASQRSSFFQFFGSPG
ncbi:hypothetical protein [Aestuariispira ectoiniformans]|uniref:hypothetical protein n=1 Tax=Aestuariispira ectoiniformans TaxID=2775080 RepID=UPI00223BB2DF|nr:hypothetical protein [Aestuariispira ectoiniformans]